MAKFVREYQPKDRYGNPIGPVQRFEAETQADLADKLQSAHENASAAFYEERKRNKLGTLLESDPEQPVYAFEERELNADELTQVDEFLKDPASRPAAIKLLIEANLGAPLEKIRENLREIEYNRRAQQNEVQVDLFLKAHPDYVTHDSNQDAIQKWLLKNKLGVTKKNLDLAYEDLKTDGILILQAPKPVETVPAPIAPASVEAVEAPVSTPPVPPAVPIAEVPVYRKRKELSLVEQQRMSAAEYKVWLESGDDEPAAPLLQPEITAAATSATPISEPPAEVRPRISSSGLSARGSSAHPDTPMAPKAKEITAQEINAMNSREYERRLRTDPEFRKQVDALVINKR